MISTCKACMHILNHDSGLELETSRWLLVESSGIARNYDFLKQIHPFSKAKTTCGVIHAFFACCACCTCSVLGLHMYVSTCNSSLTSSCKVFYPALTFVFKQMSRQKNLLDPFGSSKLILSLLLLSVPSSLSCSHALIAHHCSCCSSCRLPYVSSSLTSLTKAVGSF